MSDNICKYIYQDSKRKNLKCSHKVSRPYSQYGLCLNHFYTTILKIQHWYRFHIYYPRMKQYIAAVKIQRWYFQQKNKVAHKYAKRWIAKVREINLNLEPCSICMESFRKIDKRISNIIELPCGHSFHPYCIHKVWDDPESSLHRCPLCRKNYWIHRYTSIITISIKYEDLERYYYGYNMIENNHLTVIENFFTENVWILKDDETESLLLCINLPYDLVRFWFNLNDDSKWNSERDNFDDKYVQKFLMEAPVLEEAYIEENQMLHQTIENRILNCNVYCIQEVKAYRVIV